MVSYINTGKRDSNMSVVEGLVAVKMPSKFGDDIRIKLEDGEWYSADSSIADSIRKGATVKLKVEKSGRNTWIRKVKELSPPSGNSNASGGSRGGNRGGGGFKADPEREASIHYQSARKDAIEILKVMQEAGVLKLGQKADAKEGILMATLDRLTAQFFADIANKGAVTRYAEEADEGDEFDPEAEQEAEDQSDDDFNDEGDNDPF